MRRFITVFTLAIATLIPAAAPVAAQTIHHASHGRASMSTNAYAAKCTTTGYSKNCTGCATFGVQGKVTIKIPKTKLVATATASDSTDGTKVCLAKVATPQLSKGGIGLRVTATGSFGTLHIKKVTIYLFNPKTNKLTKVKAIKKPGIYQVVRIS